MLMCPQSERAGSNCVLDTHEASPALSQSSSCTWLCPQVKTEGGKIIRVEAHPIPEHPRPRRAQGRVALVGDAAGYVTKCSGEGIYFAAKSGRMCAEAIVEASQNGEAVSPLPYQHQPQQQIAAQACRELLTELIVCSSGCDQEALLLQG